MKLPVLTVAEMRQVEAETIAGGCSVDALMETVGRGIARAVWRFFPKPGRALVFYGKGHNGGDALVAARWLYDAGWSISLAAQERDARGLAELTRRKLDALLRGRQLEVMESGPGDQSREIKPGEREAKPAVEHAGGGDEEWEKAWEIEGPAREKGGKERGGEVHIMGAEWNGLIILDGLLGVGASGRLREDVRAMTRLINVLRRERNAQVFAIDLPTGLDAETGEADPDCVVADFTVTAGFAKRGMLADGAPAQVGRLCVAVVPEFYPHVDGLGSGEVTTPASLSGLLPRRGFDSHKTQFGRIGIIAGSPGFTGAAVLCGSGALRGGAGLVMAYARPEAQALIAGAMPPEVMVRPVPDYRAVLREKHDVLAIGPGLGTEYAEEVRHIIEHAECPVVVDADALNILAQTGVDLLERCAGPRLLTPHPGEMARLFPQAKGLDRKTAAERFTARFAGAKSPITLLLKGSRTIIHEAGKACCYNTTGNPGMGTGGMGDVLTGVCAALLGQHLPPYDAARLGAWVCGRAAELAIFRGNASEESLSAMDVVANLGNAFRLPRLDSW